MSTGPMSRFPTRARVVRADGTLRVGPADIDWYYGNNPERARRTLDEVEPEHGPHRVEEGT